MLSINNNSMLNIKNNRLFIKINTFLICLLPLALITGPAIPDFIVILVSIFFLFYFINKGFKIITDKKLFIFFIFFYFFLIFSSLFSDYTLTSLRFSMPYIRFIFLSFCIGYLIQNNHKKFYYYFFFSCLLALLILLVDSTFQFFNNKNIFGFVTPVTGRISSVFNDEMILGSYILKISPIFFTTIFYLNISFKKKKFLFFATYVSCFIVIIISGDRAPLFLFTLFSILLFILFKKFRFHFLVIIFLIIFFLLTLLSIHKPIFNRIVTQTINEIGLGEKNYSSEKFNRDDKDLEFYKKNNFFFSAVHENYFTTSLNIFKDNYFIGGGPKSFFHLSQSKKYLIDKFSASNHPHNFYFQLLAETGIIGFSFVLFFFFYLIKIFFRVVTAKINYDNNINFFIAGIPLAGLIFHLWPFITTGSFFTNYNCILLYMCLGFFLGKREYIKLN